MRRSLNLLALGLITVGTTGSAFGQTHDQLIMGTSVGEVRVMSGTMPSFSFKPERIIVGKTRTSLTFDVQFRQQLLDKSVRAYLLIHLPTSSFTSSEFNLGGKDGGTAEIVIWNGLNTPTTFYAKGGFGSEKGRGTGWATYTDGSHPGATAGTLTFFFRGYRLNDDNQSGTQVEITGVGLPVGTGPGTVQLSSPTQKPHDPEMEQRVREEQKEQQRQKEEEDRRRQEREEQQKKLEQERKDKEEERERLKKEREQNELAKKTEKEQLKKLDEAKERNDEKNARLQAKVDSEAFKLKLQQMMQPEGPVERARRQVAEVFDHEREQSAIFAQGAQEQEAIDRRYRAAVDRCERAWQEVVSKVDDQEVASLLRDIGDANSFFLQAEGAWRWSQAEVRTYERQVSAGGNTLEQGAKLIALQAARNREKRDRDEYNDKKKEYQQAIAALEKFRRIALMKLNLKGVETESGANGAALGKAIFHSLYPGDKYSYVNDAQGWPPLSNLAKGDPRQFENVLSYLEELSKNGRNDPDWYNLRSAFSGFKQVERHYPGAGLDDPDWTKSVLVTAAESGGTNWVTRLARAGVRFDSADLSYMAYLDLTEPVIALLGVESVAKDENVREAAQINKEIAVWDALHWAAYRGNRKLCEALVAAGWDPRLKQGTTWRGNLGKFYMTTPSQVADKQKFKDLAKWLKEQEKGVQK